MKNRRFKYEYDDNASALHKKVGNAIRESIYSNYEFYQEYPVVKVNPFYHSNRDRFDWVCPDLKLVIECHGRQHYQATSFGKKQDVVNTVSNFEDQRSRDNRKRDAAWQAGYAYTIIDYDDDVTPESISVIIAKALVQQASYIATIPSSLPKKNKKWNDQLNQKHKEYRQRLYKMMKEYKQSK